jgi:hypothetical protein
MEGWGISCSSPMHGDRLRRKTALLDPEKRTQADCGSMGSTRWDQDESLETLGAATAIVEKDGSHFPLKRVVGPRQYRKQAASAKERNTTLTSMAGRLREQGSLWRNRGGIAETNRRRCDPPLEEKR